MVDTLAVRLPYSHEMAGIRFPTHDALVSGAEGRFDILVAEVKSGKTNSPNKTWQRQDGVKNVEYLLRFIGWHREEAQTQNVAAELHSKYRFEDSNLRLRYIIFSRKANRTWSQKSLQYITFADCVQFISNERGQCWARSGIGRHSMHDQWNPLIKNSFQIANNGNRDAREREEEIWKMLDGE